MNDKNDSVSAPGENSDLQPVDGETTPPTDYDGITTPPTSTDRPQSENLTGVTHGPAAQSASTKSPLNTVIIALVAAIVITLGVIGYLVLSGESEPITGQQTTVDEETGVETADEGPFDPFSSENESDYSDRNSEPAAWISPAQGIYFHSGGLDQASAFEVREAFIDRIIELAEDPATPDQMPSTITNVNAGGLGEFTCRVDMTKEFNEYWECRGPDTRQITISPIIEGGILNTGDSTLHRIQQGTPHDQDWKQRALTYKSN